MNRLTPGRLAQVACTLEATARKPGNVHRFADYDDTHYLEYLLSAAAIVEPLDRARAEGVGAAVLRAVEATRRVVATNTNLGMILLFAPLAAVPDDEDLREGAARVLADLDVDDARHVYRAIRMARPGGLGEAREQDVSAEPSVTLREAMSLAADRDLIARQYANDFNDLFDLALPALGGSLREGCPLEASIVACFLRVLADLPDTLIVRKRGPDVAAEASRRAAAVLDAGPIGLDSAAIRGFDAWLRADGHARNPGATADLVAATLFVALRVGTIELPLPPGPDGWSGA